MTLIDDCVYVFGGRLVSTRTMVNTLYRLSLRTLEWTQLYPPPTQHLPNSPAPPLPAPVARYFHSAEAWGHKLVVFAGEGYAATDDDSPLCTLADVAVWDTRTSSWDLSQPKCEEGVEPPAARYAHLASVCTVASAEPVGTRAAEWQRGAQERSVMLVLGGQDIKNTYLHSVNVLDLERWTWAKEGAWDRHIGTYRAVAAAAKWTVVPGGVAPPPKPASRPSFSRSSSSGPSSPVRLERATPLNEARVEELRRGFLSKDEPDLGLGQGESLHELSYSQRSTTHRPEPLLVFSNFNFTAVRRDLDILSAPVAPQYPLDPTSLSSLMTGSSLPPGLRFPSGSVVGTHLLVHGTFLSNTVNNFAIWALDLGPAGGLGLKAKAAKHEPLPWTRVDPGSVLQHGSWNRAFSWNSTIVVLGNRERDIVKDYDHRQTNFAHVVLVDLEGFGIYQPPERAMPPSAQALGLMTLAQPRLADFEIICEYFQICPCRASLPLRARGPLMLTLLSSRPRLGRQAARLLPRTPRVSLVLAVPEIG